MRFGSLFNRVRNTIRDGGLKDRIFFLHVPKCGGTSIDEAIKSCYVTADVRKDRLLVRLDSKASAKAGSILYGLDYTYGTCKDFQEFNFREELLAYYMSLERIRYISGHFSFNDRVHGKYGDKFNFVTVLRDPVKRWISVYFYVRYRRSDRWLIESDLLDYLASDRGRSHGYEYAKLLGGARAESDYASKHSIENAKRNLHRFEVVGCVECLDHFAKSFEQRFGMHLEIKRRNENPVSASCRKPFITEEVEEKIRDVCKPDLEIYEYAIDSGLFPNCRNNTGDGTKEHR